MVDYYSCIINLLIWELLVQDYLDTKVDTIVTIWVVVHTFVDCNHKVFVIRWGMLTLLS